MSSMLCETAHPRLDRARQKRRRRDQRRVRADEAERLDEGARDARVEDVADDRDVHSLEATQRLLHRVQVEERLRRMLVLPVAGARIRLASDELGRADGRVPHHDDIRVVGREGRRGVSADSPLSTEEPTARSDIVSDRRFAALEAPACASRTRRRGSRRSGRRQPLHSRSTEDAILWAVSSTRSTSPRARSPTESKWRRGGAGARSSVIVRAALALTDEQDSTSSISTADVHARCVPSAGSCRRSQVGSEARGGLDRPGRRAVPARAGRTRGARRSRSGSSARVEDVVDDDDRSDRERNARRAHHRLALGSLPPLRTCTSSR